MEETLRRRGRWYRPWLSLRGLMLLVLVLAGALGWAVHRARVQRDAVAAIRKAKGLVFYNWQYPSGKLTPNASPPGSKWLRNLVGPDMLDPVVTVNLRAESADDQLLFRVGELSGLVRFGISGPLAPRVTPAGVSQIERLSRIEEFVCMNPGKDSGFLPQLWDKSKLRRVWLQATPVTDSDLARLTRLAKLEDIRFNGRNVSNAGFAHLAKLKQLQEISFFDCHVSDLSAVAGLNGLKRLWFMNRDRPVSGGSPVDLAPLRGLTKLEYLGISGIPVDDAGLAQIKGLNQVVTLEITGEGITPVGFADVASMPKLGFLTLWKTSLRDFTPLSPLFPRLKALHITEAPLDDESIRGLVGATGLVVLHLRDTAVTDNGLKHLTGLKNLMGLDLSGTQVSDAGLAQLVGFPKLREVMLQRTSVTEAGIAALKKASPKLKISR
ncbi:leucine-rich repeat domain-containing protein [Singulisphaera rosea]